MEKRIGQGADHAADPIEAMTGSLRLRTAMAAIDSLPPLQREVFLLHRMQEMNYLQIARRAGVSIKAVEKHMRLAMKHLAGSLD